MVGCTDHSKSLHNEDEGRSAVRKVTVHNFREELVVASRNMHPFWTASENILDFCLHRHLKLVYIFIYQIPR